MRLFLVTVGTTLLFSGELFQKAFTRVYTKKENMVTAVSGVVKMQLIIIIVLLIMTVVLLVSVPVPVL